MASKVNEKNLKAPGRMNVKLARIVNAMNLMCWPISAIGFLMGSEVIGLTFIVIALIAANILMGTGVYRIVGGKPIDDMEKALRHRSGYYAYKIFGGVIMFSLLLGFIGLDFAEDVFPHALSMRSDHIMNFLVWAAISFTMVLPAAVLAWLMPVDENHPDKM